MDFRELGKEGWGEIYSEGIAGLFRRLVREFPIPVTSNVETGIVRGDLAGSLLEPPREAAPT